MLPGSIGKTIPICAGPGNETGNAAFMSVEEAFVAEQQQDFEHFNGTLTASYQAADRLNIEATFGVDVTNGKQFYFRYYDNSLDGLVSDRTEDERSIARRHHRELTLHLEAIWDERLGNISSQFTAGAQGFISTNTSADGSGDGFPGPGIEVVGAAANKDVSEGWTQVVNTDMFAQEQIGFNDYVYVTLGARWDRSSAFGENTGGALYPKASLSIIPSDIPGWGSSLLSTLRIRGAIGRSGLQPAAFDKYTTFSSGVTAFGSVLRPSNLGNQDLEPERATEIKAGAELGFFDNIMGIEATYWHRKTTDALVDMQFPLSGGFSSFQRVNIGELKGQGLELKFDWLTLDKENLNITFFATGSYIKERIISMGTAPPIKLGGSYTRLRNYLMPPWDTDGDGDLLDTYLGKPDPDWGGSFGATITLWNRLDVNSLFEYRTGNYWVSNLTDAFRHSHGLIGQNTLEGAAAVATLANPASTEQKRFDAAMQWATKLKGLAPHSGLNQIQDAKYLALREISLTYRAPGDFASKLGLSNLSLTVAGRNLHEWTPHEGIDAESNDSARLVGAGIGNNFSYGNDSFGTPLPRRFTFAVQFGF